MRICTIRTGTGTRAARIDGDHVVPLDAPDVGALLAAAADGGRDWRDDAGRDAGEAIALADADLAPLVPRPPKIVCVGHNYKAHIAEMGAEIPTHPTLFAKFAPALVGARDPVVLPRVSQRVDWEVELAVVVARPARHASEVEAAAAIAGYTVANDVSVRDWQRRTPQWLAGKTFAQTTPLGPALVSGDEVDDARDLAVRCAVDDREVQASTTADLLFRPPALVAYLSMILPLEPGDVLLTGTPSGVGAGRTPPEFLTPGVTLHTAIAGLGACANPCVAETTP